MFITKNLKFFILALFLNFYATYSSKISEIADYTRAKQELKKALRENDLEKVRACVFYLRDGLVTLEEKQELIDYAKNPPPKKLSKKQLGYLQLGVSAATIIASYLCWTCHGNSYLADRSIALEPEILTSTNRLNNAIDRMNLGQIGSRARHHGGLVLEKYTQKLDFYGKKSGYGLSTLGLLGSGCYFGYAGLSNILSEDYSNKPEIKTKIETIIAGLPCREN